MIFLSPKVPTEPLKVVYLGVSLIYKMSNYVFYEYIHDLFNNFQYIRISVQYVHFKDFFSQIILIFVHNTFVLNNDHSVVVKGVNK